MTAIENKLLMILLKIALLDSASSELSRPSGTTRKNSRSEQDSWIVNTGTPVFGQALLGSELVRA